MGTPRLKKTQEVRMTEANVYRDETFAELPFLVFLTLRSVEF